MLNHLTLLLPFGFNQQPNVNYLNLDKAETIRQHNLHPDLLRLQNQEVFYSPGGAN